MDFKFCPPGRGPITLHKPLTRRNTSRRAAIYLRERTLKMMILRDDDGWARIGGNHSGRTKGMGVSGGERFGGCVLSIGMRERE